MLDSDQLLAQNGCPIGTLCSESHKQGGLLVQYANWLFELLLSWLAAQIRLLGKQEAEDLTLHLLSAMEGAAVLTLSFQTSEYFVREAR